MPDITSTLIVGDCREVLASIPENTYDAVVTDPPYELGFMGKSWDNAGVSFESKTWEAVFRVLKPGGHLLCFGGTRTFHRIAVAIEDAGFEIRDCLSWLYGSGFPKSLNVSKAIDKAAGAERTIKTGVKPGHEAFIGREDHPLNGGWDRPWASDPEAVDRYHSTYAPATPEAEQWDGWGTALKPAWEPIIMARKPVDQKTVAANVLAHGTGAINIDATRVSTTDTYVINTFDDGAKPFGNGAGHEYTTNTQPLGGRWPANLLLDETAADLLDAMSGERKSGGYPPEGGQRSHVATYGKPNERGEQRFTSSTGGASRYFLVAPIDDPDAEHTRLCLICNGTYTPKHSIMNGTKGDTPCESVVTARKSSNRTGKANSSATDHVPGLLPLDFEGNNQSNDGHANSAALSSSNTRPTLTSTVPSSAWDSLTEQLAPRVSDAANLCEKCTTRIAQSLASLLTNREPLPVGPDSITDSRNSILTRSLASFAEPMVNTGIIPTTASLSILFGFVRDAMRHSTPTVETAIDPDQLRFRYQSKASRRERNAGLEGMPERAVGSLNMRTDSHSIRNEMNTKPAANTHPTVKPLALMRWLVRLVTPPGGTILDPFTGSGSTGCAALIEGFDFVGIELDAEYVAIAERRIAHWHTQGVIT